MDKNRWGKDINANQKKVAERLKEARVTNGLTLKEVGDHIGVKGVTILRYENADISVPFDRLERLADLYCISPIYLMGWDNPSPHYIDVKVAKYARELYANQTLRELFADILVLSEEQQREVSRFIKFLKHKESNNDD